MDNGARFERPDVFDVASRAHTDIVWSVVGEPLLIPNVSMEENIAAFYSLHAAPIGQAAKSRVTHLLFEHREVLKGNLPKPVAAEEIDE